MRSLMRRNREKRSRSGCVGPWLAAALLALPMAADAQDAGISIGAFMGAFVPLSDVIATGSWNVKQQVGPAFGGRVVYGLGPRLGMEGVLAIATGDVEGSGPTSASASGRKLLVSARGRWRVSAPGAALPLYVSGGLGVVSHGGTAYELLDGTTDIGGVLGIGTAIPLRDRMRLRIDLEDYVHSASFSFNGAGSSGRLQNDILLSAGISFTVSDRPLSSRTTPSRNGHE